MMTNQLQPTPEITADPPSDVSDSRVVARLREYQAALEETLSARVIGDLKGEQPLTPHEAALVERGIAFYERFAIQNNVSARTWPTYQRLLREKSLNEGLNHQRQGRFAEAERAYRRAVREAEDLDHKHPHEPAYRQALAYAYQMLANALLQGDHPAEGERYLQKGHALHLRLVLEYPDRDEFRYTLGGSNYNLGRQYMFAGRSDAAEASYRAALPLLEEAIAADPSGVYYRHARARCLYNLGHLLGTHNRPDEARTMWRQCLSAWRELADDFPNNSEYRSRVGATLNNLAVLAKDRGDFDEARTLVEDAIAHQERALTLEPVYHNAESFLATHKNLLAELPEEAEE